MRYLEIVSFLHTCTTGQQKKIYEVFVWGFSGEKYVYIFYNRRNYTPSFPRHAAKPSPLTAAQTQPHTLITPPEKTAVEPPPVKQPFSIAGLFQKSKELFVFYKNGVKLLLGNRKTVKELKEAQRKGQVWNRREFQMVGWGLFLGL